MDLARKKCVPCEGGTKPMKRREAKTYLAYAKGWRIEGKSISKELAFRDFRQTMRFVNKVADLAEKEGHHPDIYLHSWNKLKLSLSTHAIGGLSINDFILASKINNVRGS